MSYDFRSRRPDRQEDRAATAYRRTDGTPPASPPTERRQRPVEGDQRRVGPDETPSRHLASFGDPDLAAAVQRQKIVSKALRQIRGPAGAARPAYVAGRRSGNQGPTRSQATEYDAMGFPFRVPEAPYPGWPPWSHPGPTGEFPFPGTRRRKPPDMSLESVLFRVLTGTGGWDQFLGRFGALSRGTVSPWLRDILSDSEPAGSQTPDPGGYVLNNRSPPRKAGG